MNEKQYIRLSKLAQNLDVSPRTVYRWAKKEGFPQPFKLGDNTTVFNKNEINAWLRQQESRQAQPKKNNSRPTAA